MQLEGYGDSVWNLNKAIYVVSVIRVLINDFFTVFSVCSEFMQINI